ncbi:thioredoxin fold domain-containing protein [Luteolibacter sp. Populi]|uniref:thioredoxin fold domain-containing protein n=1 Tax=Luteolibacter sp. Populi TaxID=3230487 RepID=UPI003466F76D
MKPARWLTLLPAALLLASCGLTKPDKPEVAISNNSGPGGIPPHMLKGFDGGGTAVTPGGNQQKAQAAAAAAAASVDYTEADLAWTDADNPDAEIPELSKVMTNATEGTRWLESETQALRESKKTGKPLVIWFTDSVNSPACKSLSTRLLETNEFENWATENTVRLVIDQHPGGKGPDDVTRRTLHNRELKKKYNASGYPTFMVITPGGEVIDRYKGYRKGKEDFFFGQVKQGVSLAAEKQSAWKSSLTKKGYREWSDGKGRSIFAKLSYYKDGDLILAEPDGQRARTHEKNLSDEDRGWIEKQKAARGIQ